MILESETPPRPAPAATAAEGQTVRLAVTIYVPPDCRISSHQFGPLDTHLARVLTHALDCWLPSISTGRRPQGLAMAVAKGGAK